VAIVVRTWNLFHGNAVPSERRGYLRQMVELVAADAPGIVCLQEVPVWALRHLEAWSGMRALGAIAAVPRVSAELGRWVTELHHGLLRSALTGQANAMLVAPDLDVAEEPTLVISESGERRICQLARVRDLGVVGNFHATSGAAAEKQVRRAVDFVAAANEHAIIGGDANLRPGEGQVYDRLASLGFSAPLAGSIDQILVRGRASTPPASWPADRRRVGGTLLSDHAPVELTVE
jgi:endonuclease/exonuclease/phosphatase family metal-dependent hydrolase